MTGAVMGVFGVSNDKFRGMMEGGLGEYAGRSLGYASSLGGRTAILTGSSVMGQYLEDPNFDINNVDWTKEIAHAGLMNLGFDILGAVKKYQAEKKSGIRMRDVEKLNLTKEDIEQLNQAGVSGKDAQEIAESILQVKDAKELRREAPEGKGLVPSDFGFASQELGISKEGSVLGQLLSNENIDLATKAKVAYLMTGMQFRLAPNTNVSDVQEQADGSFTVEKFNPSGQTNETHRFKTREAAEKYRHDAQNEVQPNQVSVLEGMMDNAGKMASATRVFDMVAKMYRVTKEEVAGAYARGRRGETLNERERQAFATLDNLLRSVEKVEDYHYSVNELKRRMDEGYNQDSGWMDKVLKKKYNSLNETERRAYDEYIANMKLILQGNQGERMQLGNGETMQAEMPANAPALPGSGMPKNEAPAVPEGPTPPALPVATTPPATNAMRRASRQTGAEIYAEHDPIKMREAVVRERVAYSRLRNAGFSKDDIVAMAIADDAGREAMLSALDSNQRRLAEDYLAQTDLVEGLNDAMVETHLPEADAAEALTQKMTAPNGKVTVVSLGKHSDETHEYGVVVSGIGADGNLTSPEGQIIVVPIRSQNWTPDYSSFDDTKAISMRMEEARGDVSTLDPEAVAETLLGDYQADMSLLEMSPIGVGEQVTLADEEGNSVNAQVVGQALDGGWLVLEEGQSEPVSVSEAELQQMRMQAEQLPIMQAYAEADKAYERV